MSTEERIEEAARKLQTIVDYDADYQVGPEGRRILRELIAGEAADAARYRALRDSAVSLGLTNAPNMNAAVDALRESARVGGEEVGRGK